MTETNNDVHLFDNGIKVFDRYLVPPQRERYRVRNVHEHDEEDIFINIIRRLPENGCFVNVGAGFGYYILLAKKLVPRLVIHAFEPLDAHAQALTQNIKLNGFSLDDFVVRNEALSTRDGFTELLMQGYGSQIEAAADSGGVLARLVSPAYFKTVLGNFFPSQNVHVRRPDVRPGARCRVRTIALSTLVRDVGGTVDLLQMDIQGVEIDVLNAAKKTLRSGAVQSLLIGTHGKQIHDACLKTLSECGYTIEYQAEAPAHQPDGIILASHKNTTSRAAANERPQQR